MRHDLRAQGQGSQVLLIKSRKDSRYHEHKVVTHSGQSRVMTHLPRTGLADLSVLLLQEGVLRMPFCRAWHFRCMATKAPMVPV